MIDGEIFFDRQREMTRRVEFLKERAQLEQAEPNRSPQRGTAPEVPRRRRPTNEDDDHWDGGQP